MGLCKHTNYPHPVKLAHYYNKLFILTLILLEPSRLAFESNKKNLAIVQVSQRKNLMAYLVKLHVNPWSLSQP